MKKDLLLQEIEYYSNYYKKKNKQLEYFIMGMNVNEEKLCRKIENLKIKKWFDKRKKLLDFIYGTRRMNKLDTYFEEWHDEMQKICKVLMIQEIRRKTFLQKVFSSKKTDKNNKKYLKEQDKIKVWKNNLEEITMRIEHKFKMMINRLNAIPQDMIKTTESEKDI